VEYLDSSDHPDPMLLAHSEEAAHSERHQGVHSDSLTDDPMLLAHSEEAAHYQVVHLDSYMARPDPMLLANSEVLCCAHHSVAYSHGLVVDH
jgi:hypothetical protein